MTETFIELTIREFDNQYTFLPNHITPSSSWACGKRNYGLFETYGEEFDYVRHYDPKNVWTLIDGNDGNLYAISGLYYINRLGYLLSREQVTSNTTIEVYFTKAKD
jgi:hypothetical protein